jgi:hypothetical protein
VRAAIFPKLSDLTERFVALGATRILCKALAENDNSKQQIYLGGSFEALQLLPYREVRAEPGIKSETFKAGVGFSWIDSRGRVVSAPGAQLILYSKYPEVRLSGFLRGCAIAPSEHMRPVPAGQRASSGPDGRLLFLATTQTNEVLGYLSLPQESLSAEVEALIRSRRLRTAGVFHELPIKGQKNSRDSLLAKLREIHLAGWHSSRRLDSGGNVIVYKAQNGGGYTLEALLGIVPNGISEPDYLGWELKAHSSGRITLITPEPDTGYYGKHGVEAFVRKYGRALPGDVMYFTGTHQANLRCSASGQTLTVRGFNLLDSKIVDANGGIELLDSSRAVAAGWSFGRLIEHWGRKHAAAAYVKFERQASEPPNYRYLSPVLLGEGTDFIRYLAALVAGKVVYDPGSKITAASTRPKVKARSQFRVRTNELSSLYYQFDRVDL